jgi:hypothetical protein
MSDMYHTLSILCVYYSCVHSTHGAHHHITSQHKIDKDCHWTRIDNNKGHYMRQIMMPKRETAAKSWQAESLYTVVDSSAFKICVAHQQS